MAVEMSVLSRNSSSEVYSVARQYYLLPWYLSQMRVYYKNMSEKKVREKIEQD